MRKKKVLAALGYSLLLFFTLSNEIAGAQNISHNANEGANESFQLKNGDRVVFLGNSIFENDLRYGYLELVLTTRWPNSDVIYRNMGWTGDTVFGESRGNISSPRGYDLLIDQLTKSQPTVVFIAYGSVEASGGEAGVPRFNDGLNKLLDKIDELGAKSILLSPIPVMSASSVGISSKSNATLKLYASVIAETASKRDKQFIDVFNPLLAANETAKISDNGFHLNENGYYYLASIIEEALGLTTNNEAVIINVSKQGVTATGPAKILESGKNNWDFTFTIDERYLPLPPPTRGEAQVNNARILKITGLKKGFYSLNTGNTQVITASANHWEEGVALERGPSFDQVDRLREKIIKKNELFFRQYRPLNRTYILGFRSHEQGRHVKGLEDLGIIVTWLEGQIALARTPGLNIYQLTRVK